MIILYFVLIDVKLDLSLWRKEAYEFGYLRIASYGQNLNRKNEVIKERKRNIRIK
jgi:hypothetical protein